jgi:hypothetical protein
MSAQPHDSFASDNTSLFQSLDAYPWDSDPEFQGGLSAILGSVQDPQQIAHLTLRAKCYYYARKAGTSVDFDGYKAWTEQRRNGTGENGYDGDDDIAAVSDLIASSNITASTGGDVDAAASGLPEAPKPASFAEICDLIAEGKPIPGIKDIPDTVLEGQKSTSQAESRRKPWERSVQGAEEDKPSWMV